MNIFMSFLIAVLMAMTGGSISANAASSSWQEIGGGTARIIASLDPATNQINGALEVRLEPGWTTYWRYPGSSGIPPMFNFSGSSSYRHETIEFPGPQRIDNIYGAYAGYKNRVLFPFGGAFTGNLNGEIHLKLLIGVCSDICIPAQAEMKINAKQLLRSDPAVQQTINLAKAAVPITRSADEIMLDLQRSDEETMQITVSHKPDGSEPALFVEGPQDWYLKPAKLVSIVDNKAIFTLDISSVPAGTDVLKQSLRFTLVAGSKAIETTR